MAVPIAKRVGADQAAVTFRPPAAQAAHHAEPAKQSDRAIDQTDEEAGEDDDVGSGVHGLVPVFRHCEERSDEAIHSSWGGEMDCFASLAMTIILNHGRRITRSRDEPATAVNATLACSSG